jgi:hypothetical protein
VAFRDRGLLDYRAVWSAETPRGSSGASGVLVGDLATLGTGAETSIDMDLMITPEFHVRSRMRVRCIGHVTRISDRRSLNTLARDLPASILSPVVKNVCLSKENSL